MVRRNMEDCSEGGERRGLPPVAVVTGHGGGCDVRYNLLAGMVPGTGLWCWLAACPPDGGSWQRTGLCSPQHPSCQGLRSPEASA